MRAVLLAILLIAVGVWMGRWVGGSVWVGMCGWIHVGCCYQPRHTTMTSHSHHTTIPSYMHHTPLTSHITHHQHHTCIIFPATQQQSHHTHTNQQSHITNIIHASYSPPRKLPEQLLPVQSASTSSYWPGPRGLGGWPRHPRSSSGG